MRTSPDIAGSGLRTPHSALFAHYASAAGPVLRHVRRRDIFNANATEREMTVPKSLAHSSHLRTHEKRQRKYTQNMAIPRTDYAMSKVVALMSMSLDGYVADLNDGVAEVFDWYFTSGEVEIRTGGSDAMTFRVSQPSADHLHRLISEL